MADAFTVYPIPKGVRVVICGYWGDPRGGGTRTHQGVDLCCPEGTPILAPSPGTLKFGPDPLGGNTFSIYRSDGTHIYGAHLSAYEGQPRTVKAGEVVGYVGHSGDAQANLPHLHLGLYTPAGAIDPLPFVKLAPRVDVPSSLPLQTIALAAGSATAIVALAWAIRRARFGLPILPSRA